MLPPFTPTGLYWSLKGHVVCREHAATIPEAEWKAEGWAPLPESSQGRSGTRYQCERCAPDHTAIIHPNDPALHGEGHGA